MTCSAVTGAMVETLREHFRGGQISPGISCTRSGQAVDDSLNVLELAVTEWTGDPVIVTDGSAHGPEQPTAVSACAAVTAGGQIIAGWYATPDWAEAVPYAEWQGIRLGLRLAARLSAPVRLLTDSRVSATRLQRILSGHPLPYSYGEADNEIRRLAAAIPFTVTCQDSGKGRDATAATTLARCAHTVAWAVRRIVADGGDPAGTPWLQSLAAAPPAQQRTLSRRYKRM